MNNSTRASPTGVSSQQLYKQSNKSVSGRLTVIMFNKIGSEMK